jgi:hypothetical protein
MWEITKVQFPTMRCCTGLFHKMECLYCKVIMFVLRGYNSPPIIEGRLFNGYSGKGNGGESRGDLYGMAFLVLKKSINYDVTRMLQGRWPVKKICSVLLESI